MSITENYIDSVLRDGEMNVGKISSKRAAEIQTSMNEILEKKGYDFRVECRSNGSIKKIQV